MRSYLKVAVAGVVLSFGLAQMAHATPFTVTGSGSSTSGDLSGEASVTFGTGTISITLTNNLATTMRDSGQALSDLELTLDTSPGSVSLSTQAGSLGDVCGTKNCSSVTAIAGDPNHWGASASGDVITLTALTGGQPRNMILPFNASVTYDFNKGVDNFNPYILGTGTFTISAPGVTVGTKLTAAEFSFGTGPDSFLTGTISGGGSTRGAVPEPASLLLLGTGLAGVVAIRARRRS